MGEPDPRAGMIATAALALAAVAIAIHAARGAR
jgi:hypothetical protein